MKRQIVSFFEKYSWFKTAFDYYKGLRFAKSKIIFHKTEIGSDGLPIPEPLLLVSTTGSANPEVYLDGGLKAKESIADALASQGIKVSQFDRVLDFGCGCGRVLRHWHSFNVVEFHAVDIDRKAVRWCNNNLPFCHSQTCNLDPPLLFESGMFSFVYALSVLTHLPESQQQVWLKEWRRVLRPGGYLLFTLHGDFYRPSLTESERLTYDAGQMVVRNPKSAGSNRCGTFHPPEYVMSRLTEGFEVLKHIPCGARGNPDQDLYLFQRKEHD